MLAVAVLAACEPDSDSITGVAESEGTLDHHPERQSCHFAPEALKTIEGSDEVVLIEFEYGGGETWSTCHSNPDSISGVLLAADGVSYSDSVGGDGDFLALPDCALSAGSPRACNVPSLINALWIDALLGLSGYLRFDPPISEISFMVCSSQPHGLTAWDSLGNLVVPETAGPITASPCAPEDWVPFGIESPGGDYDISRVRLRRWDSGYAWWDDMTFRREAPPILECTKVTRPAETTCSLDPQAADSVHSWEFAKPYEYGTLFADTVMQAFQWSGKAVVDSGTVMVRFFTQGILDSASTVLRVGPRATDDWNWDADDWDLAEDVTPTTCPFIDWRQPFSTDPKLGYNRPKNATDCNTNLMFTPVITSPDSALAGVVAKQITDGGPNDGLWYVDSVHYRMDRATEIHTWLKPGSSWIIGSESNKDKNACNAPKNEPLLINTYDFNNDCKGVSLDPLLQGIKLHEGYGTITTGPDANGHESRNRYAASQPENDPHLIAEALVAHSEGNLGALLSGRLAPADAAIRVYGADTQHQYVNGNFAGMDVWTFNDNPDSFQKFATGGL